MKSLYEGCKGIEAMCGETPEMWGSNVCPTALNMPPAISPGS